MEIWHRSVTAEELNARAEETLARSLGIVFTEVGENYIRGTMPVDRRTRQPAGILHGGASVALAETLGSVAAWMSVDDTRFLCVGMTINASHIRAKREGVVTGTARPVHVGRSTHVWLINICDEEGKMIATSRLTIAVLLKR